MQASFFGEAELLQLAKLLQADLAGVAHSAAFDLENVLVGVCDGGDHLLFRKQEVQRNSADENICGTRTLATLVAILLRIR
jgi:hypothetical protein